MALPNDLKRVADVVLDSSGASRFNELMRSRSVAIFAAFDVLWLNGEDLRDLPIVARKLRLRDIVRANSKRVLYVGHIEEHGKALFNVACDQDLEGIVAKPVSVPIGRFAANPLDQDQESEIHAIRRTRRDVQPTLTNCPECISLSTPTHHRPKVETSRIATVSSPSMSKSNRYVTRARRKGTPASIHRSQRKVVLQDARAN